MKHIVAGAAVAALVALAFSGSAEARMQRHHGSHHGIHYSWHHGNGRCCGPYSWGPMHAKSDFVANQMNRREIGLIAYNGALGMDKVMLNPQPLPPRQ
jgi:hypothetical protein